MDWLQCNICFSKYKESLARPCVLPCGHTYCHHCIDATILDSSISCPECRQIHDIVSASQLPVNYVLVGLIEQLNLSKDSENSTSYESSRDSTNNESSDIGAELFEKTQKSYENQKGLLKLSAGMCHEHIDNELKYRCTNHKSWICCECISEEHPKDICSVIAFQEEIQNRKGDQKIFLQTELQFCQKTLDHLKMYAEQLEVEKQNHVKILLQLNRIMEKHMSVREELLAEQTAIFQLLDEGKSQHEELSNNEVLVSGASTLHDSNLARQKLKKKASEASDWRKLSSTKCDNNRTIDDSIECRKATEVAVNFHDICLYGKCLTEAAKEVENNPFEELLPVGNRNPVSKLEDNQDMVHKYIEEKEIKKDLDNKIKLFIKVTSNALKPLYEARKVRKNNEEVRLYGKLLQPPLNLLLPQLIGDALICELKDTCTNKIQFSSNSFDKDNALNDHLDNTEGNTKSNILLDQRLYGKDMLNGSKIVAYAVLTEDNVSSEFAVTRNARISIKDGRLHLHALKKHVPLPEGAICFPYWILRNMVDMSKALTFLDVGWRGSSNVGRVYTRVLADTPRGNQYVWFCTGEKGPSYGNTVFCAHSNKGLPGEWLGIGDGRFSIPLVSDLTTGSEYCHPKEAGILSAVRMGEDNSCQNGKFGVTIKSSPGKSSVAFGRVESGLSVFQLVAELGEINQASIIDCGIVIPL